MSRKRRKNDYVEEYFGFSGQGFRTNNSRNRKALYEAMFVRILLEFATNRFKWSGLPEEVDRRFLELELARSGLVLFFKEEKDFNRYFAIRGTGSGRPNMYDNPTTFTYSNPMMHGTHGPKDCVPIWGNTLRVPDWDLIRLQAEKLAEIERTIEINLLAMRKPWIVAVEDSQRLTMQNVFRQAQEGEPVIWGTEAMQSVTDQVKLLDLKIDKDLVLNLQVSKSKIWNETMTYLGIDNANQDKRERLVASEVSANDAQIKAARNSAMGAREYACEQINAMYPDLTVNVEWNEDESTETVDGNNLGTEDSSSKRYVDSAQAKESE